MIQEHSLEPCPSCEPMGDVAVQPLSELGFWPWLIQHEVFMPRNQCGPGWSDTLIKVHLLSEFLISSAYFLIGLFLIILWYILHTSVAWIPRYLLWGLPIFGSFFLGCGATHYISALMFETPVYRLSAAALSLTAVASWLAAPWLLAVVCFCAKLVKAQKVYDAQRT